MVVVGVLHFTDPTPFVRIVPQELPAPGALVAISGVAEIALGFAIQISHERFRRLAVVGLVALYVAVFPANINMAVRHIDLNPEHSLSAWASWARLPFQLLFI